MHARGSVGGLLVGALASLPWQGSATATGMRDDAELGYPAMVVSLWFGLVAPAGTPQSAIDTLKRGAQQGLGIADGGKEA